MERLTKRKEKNGQRWIELRCCADCSECCDCEDIWMALDRLAAYEDTGLTPEEVAELAKAKADWRLTELPCKVGDTVWAEAAIGPFGNPLMPYEVKEIAFECFGDFGDATCWFTFDKADLGKTVFLTRAEAEAALRKEQSDER